MGISPAFFEGKSECRVRVFLESGFCTGPSPGPSPSPVRVSQYASLKILDGCSSRIEEKFHMWKLDFLHCQFY